MCTASPTGTLSGVALATGTETEIGKIGEMVSRIEKVTTPSLRQIGRFHPAMLFNGSR
jgi:magnesium-transporting ATPase (P-type)